MFIFSPKVYNFWDSQLRHMRIARIRLWKSRKKRMAEKARKARYRARLDKAEAWIAQAEKDILKVGHEEKTETQPNPLDEYNEVIGKTKIVYLEDPDVARKTPTRSEPMKKEPIEEDEDIDPDDVIDGFSSQKGLTESENIGWQQQLGLTAMGSGQLWGVGYLKGGSHQLYARNNDFIFTVAGEEFGFVGALLLIVILVLLFCLFFSGCPPEKRDCHNGNPCCNQ